MAYFNRLLGTQTISHDQDDPVRRRGRCERLPDGLEQPQSAENGAGKSTLLIQAGDVGRTILQVDAAYFNPDDFPDIISYLERTGPQGWGITSIPIPIERFDSRRTTAPVVRWCLRRT